jgi:hypothetical protein
MTPLLRQPVGAADEREPGSDDPTPIRVAARHGAPEIMVGPDESRVIDDAIAAIARAPEVYVRGGELVEVIVDEPQTKGVCRDGRVTRIVRMQEARVRELMAREAEWLGPDGSGKSRVVHPPQWSVRGVMARGQWPGVRPIVAIATAPTMRVDGSILSKPGYDSGTGLLLSPSVNVTVPERPTKDDAAKAITALLDVVCNFPVGVAAKSAWLAGVVTIAARPAIEGPVPMIIIDASVRGAGKTLLADVAAVIATGRVAARMIYSRDDTEVRKVITAVALVGDPMVLLDNVTGELGCAALDAALTADTWRDRVLGSSTMTTEIPLRISWWATGNGVIVGADLVRRALLVRLEPECEHPEERSGWRYPSLLTHVAQHRAELLSAALTIVRGYVVAGRPDMRLTPMGSFEAWSALVRSALVWAGASDPCGTVTELRAADAKADAMRTLIRAWPVPDRKPVTTAELLQLATPDSDWRAALTEWCPPRGSADLPTANLVGYALRAMKGRIVGAHLLSPTARTNKGIGWARLPVGGGDDRDDRDDGKPVRGDGRFDVSVGDQSSRSSRSSPGDEVPSPDDVDGADAP